MAYNFAITFFLGRHPMIVRFLLYSLAVVSTANAFTTSVPETRYQRSVIGSVKSPTSLLSTAVSTQNNAFVGILDEETMLAKSTFPIKPTDLIARAKECLSQEIGLGTKDGGECLADDFEFVAAVIGPIGKDEYLKALRSFSIEDAFEIAPNIFGLTVDPTQPNRVYFFNRVVGTHVGNFMGAEPTGKEIIYPPQAHHIDFNENGKVKEYGFYTCDRRQGNTGGLGGALGFMYGVGKPLPIPECQPYKPSKRLRLLNFFGRLSEKLKKNN